MLCVQRERVTLQSSLQKKKKKRKENQSHLLGQNQLEVLQHLVPKWRHARAAVNHEGDTGFDNVAKHAPRARP